VIGRQDTRWEPLGSGQIAPAGSVADGPLAALLATYKNRIAGAYRSVAPDAIALAIPGGDAIVSPKIDGETWFLRVTKGEAHLLSPTGRVITGIPLTNEAAGMGRDRSLVFAGELYAGGGSGRPRVHDLHAALGRGSHAAVDRIRFAAFDLLEDGPTPPPQGGTGTRRVPTLSTSSTGRHPFPVLARRIAELLEGGALCHSVPFETVCGPAGIVEAYDRLVTRGGHEGIVVRAATGTVYKIKPEITLDAVIVGFTERIQGGVAELLLALLRPDGSFLLLGRVDTGFTNADRQDLSGLLRPLVAPAVYRAVARSGALFRFVRPEIVVEVKCNDILTTRATGEPIRRMLLGHLAEGWQPLGLTPAASLVNSVFRRIRTDKSVTVDTVRLSQVSDLTPIAESSVRAPMELAPSTILRREVVTKHLSTGTGVRKALLWKTNKEQADPFFPRYVAFFTDYAPSRREPLQTDLRVGASADLLDARIEAWLAENRSRGWATPEAASGSEPRSGLASGPSLPGSCFLGSCPTGSFRLDLTISFARTPSVNLAVAVRRIKALASAGRLSIEEDDKGRPTHFELALRQDALVEHIRRIENLHRVISRWRSAEVAVNGDPLDLHGVQGVFNQIGEIAACWRRQCQGAPTSSNPCRAGFVLGCRQIRFSPASGFPGLAREHPAWYAVGAFDGKRVALDKSEMSDQLSAPLNRPLAVCPFYQQQQVEARIGSLPDHLDADADPTRWATGCSLDGSKPLWVFPKKIAHLPFGVTLEPGRDPIRSALESAVRVMNATGSPASALPMGVPSQAPGLSGTTALPSRRVIPSARYADVRGQDAAVEAVRDYAELPLRHPELFEKVGVRPGRGILLWGPPGNGKTLLARAVAGESNAHIETINGPELLSKWVGEAERHLREVFERAGRLAPSVILMDELDAIATTRDSSSGENPGEVVSQLLVLMDGLHDRGRILVLGTTNRPQRIDSALLRPGRLDRKVYVGPPDEAGRLAILEKLLERMPLADDLDRAELALATPDFSGADLEHFVNEAGLLAVKQAIATQSPPEAARVRRADFVRALALLGETQQARVPRRTHQGAPKARPVGP
jgi:AAA+ superfamily predicted ATPase